MPRWLVPHVKRSATALVPVVIRPSSSPNCWASAPLPRRPTRDPRPAYLRSALCRQAESDVAERKAVLSNKNEQMREGLMSRAAGDTWDIVSSVGFTALAVCAARAFDALLTPPSAADEFAAGFVQAAGEPNLIAAVANTDMDSPTAFNAQWVGVRTRFFDDYFVAAGRSRTRQAVILAAGLDARAYRLQWPGDYTVFEVDQPRVLEFKQQVLDQRGAVPTARRVPIATDLRDDWAGALIAAGFDARQPTAWGLEGLLPYLPGAAQNALFEKLHELSAAGSQIAAELGPVPGELQEFAENILTISQA